MGSKVVHEITTLQGLTTSNKVEVSDPEKVEKLFKKYTVSPVSSGVKDDHIQIHAYGSSPYGKRTKKRQKSSSTTSRNTSKRS